MTACPECGNGPCTGGPTTGEGACPKQTAATTSPAKLIAEAKNAAGDHAVAAHKRGDFKKSREWQAFAVECDRLLRDAVAVMAS